MPPNPYVAQLIGRPAPPPIAQHAPIPFLWRDEHDRDCYALWNPSEYAKQDLTGRCFCSV